MLQNGQSEDILAAVEEQAVGVIAWGACLGLLYGCEGKGSGEAV